MNHEGTLLHAVIYLPLVAGIILAFLPKEQLGLIKAWAIGATALTFFLSVAMAVSFNVDRNAEFDYLTSVPWVQLGNGSQILYKTGVDGISLLMILLTTLLSLISVIYSWDVIHERVREYFVTLLILETGMLGVFAALDLILFYVFWEAMLIPMYFLIGIWGGPRKLYATIKFVLYTLFGSLLMLVAIVWIYIASGSSGQPGTFDLQTLADPNGPLANNPILGPNVRVWLFLAFALSFAIKVPMFPLHTWLPDAHVEAPTAGSVILAGVLLKMGTYGFLRFAIPLFPDAAVRCAPAFMILSVIGIIYGALVAYVQTDVKRLVAYSSVSHLGFCMLGLFAFTREGVMGSVLQMVNHGLSTGALFLLVGMIYERRHTREIAQFGGLWKQMPIFGLFFLIVMLSSIGLPLLNGFVGEFLILVGTWGGPASPQYNHWAAVLGSTGVILSAVYMLWMFQRVMQGPLDREENRRLRDLNLREIGILVPLVLLMFWIGVRPTDTLRMYDQAAFQNYIRPVDISRQLLPAPPPSVSPNGPPGFPGGLPNGLPPGFRMPSSGMPTPRTNR